MLRVGLKRIDEFIPSNLEWFRDIPRIAVHLFLHILSPLLPRALLSVSSLKILSCFFVIYTLSSPPLSYFAG